MKRVLALAALGALMAAPSRAQNEYVIEPEDVLTITVWGQDDLNTKYPVDPDGTLMFPFLGRLEAAGQTADQLAAELTRRLGEGYFRNPRVRVSVERGTPARIFVFGGVGSPGSYPLAENMTLIEALARAGYPGASEAIIVRTEGATGPVLPGENASSRVIRVNLREFEKDVEQGELWRNVVLEDGDTVYVPRVDRNRVFVTGEVRNPGAYSIPEGTTVLEAITIAGGMTEHAADGRIKIIRLVDGERETLKANLETEIEPGDTIVVPERWF